MTRIYTKESYVMRYYLTHLARRTCVPELLADFNRQPSKVKREGCYAFRFYDRAIQTEYDAPDRQKVTRGEPERISNFYFFGLAMPISEVGHKFPHMTDLIHNAHQMNLSRVCLLPTWQFFAMEAGDFIITEGESNA